MNEKKSGYPCYQCQKFYENERDAVTCRHEQNTIATPPGFWRTDFPASQEILDKKYMLTETDPLPDHAKPKWLKQKENRINNSKTCEKDEVIVSKSDSSTTTEEASSFSPPSKRQFYSSCPEYHSSESVVLVADTSSSSASSSYVCPSQKPSLCESNSQRGSEKTVLKVHPISSANPTVTYDCVFDGNTIMIIKDSSSAGIDDTGPDVIIEELSPTDDGLKNSFESMMNDSSNHLDTSLQKSFQHGIVEQPPGTVLPHSNREKKRKQPTPPVSRNRKLSNEHLREAAAMYSGFHSRSQHPSKKLRSFIEDQQHRTKPDGVVVLSDDEPVEEDIVQLSSSDEETGHKEIGQVKYIAEQNRPIADFVKERSLDIVPLGDATILTENVEETIQVNSIKVPENCREIKQSDTSLKTDTTDDINNKEDDNLDNSKKEDTNETDDSNVDFIHKKVVTVDVDDEVNTSAEVDVDRTNAAVGIATNNVDMSLPSSNNKHSEQPKTSVIQDVNIHSSSVEKSGRFVDDVKTRTTQNSKKKRKNLSFYQGAGAFLNEFLNEPKKAEALKHSPIIASAGARYEHDCSVVDIDQNNTEANSSRSNGKQMQEEIGSESKISKQFHDEKQGLLEHDEKQDLLEEESQQSNIEATADGTESNADVSESMGGLRFVEYKNLEKPEVIAHSVTEFQRYPENYLRGCQWSPDGGSILTNSDDNILRLFMLPATCYEEEDACPPVEMSATLRVKDGGTVYDFDWYPFMDSTNPDTCCFLTTSKDHPVHLWDSLSGRVRCSYRAFDHLDELVSCHCVQFNLDGSKIYCGFNKVVRVFDSSRPGREFTEIHTVAKKNDRRKSKPRFTLNRNQTGIISCLAFSTCYTGLLAMGSFSKTIGLYSTDNMKLVHLLDQQVGGHVGGVTQLKFTEDGCFLFSGGRKDPEIICWDMRNTTMPLFKLRRQVRTNQRIQFDIDRAGGFVVSGNTNKMVSMYDMNPIFENISDEVLLHEQSRCFQAHDDAVNAVSLNPRQPFLATTSGQRHFYMGEMESGDETDERLQFDNSLKVWKL